MLRVLTDLDVVKSTGPDSAFAERLAHWMTLDDAITLRAVHASRVTALQPVATSSSPADLRSDFAQLRASLVSVIDLDGAPKAVRPRPGARAPQPEAPLDLAAVFAAYRRDYLAHRRTMVAQIRAFRARARAVLAAATPTLARLAALDAAFDSSLAERETQALAPLPALLEPRLAFLHAAQQATTQGAMPSRQPAPNAWLARFGRELRAVLLAELDFRLLPVLGLVEAFHHPVTPYE